MTTIEERFWMKVSIAGANKCWPWIGARSKAGYGNFGVEGKTVGAHVFSYKLHNGSVPNGLDVMHSCDNKWCVQPQHLILGTRSRNMQDAHDRGLVHRKYKLKLFCKNGHPFNSINTRYSVHKDRPNPTRHCRRCERERQRKHRS